VTEKGFPEVLLENSGGKKFEDMKNADGGPRRWWSSVRTLREGASAVQGSGRGVPTKKLRGSEKGEPSGDKKKGGLFFED